MPSNARPRSSGRDHRHQLRMLGAILVVAIGGIHLYLWFDYFHQIHVIGVLFLVNAATGVAIAGWLFLSDGVLALVAGAGFAVTTLAAFLISAHWGLFGFHERFSGTWQSTAGLLELVTTVLLGTLAVRSVDRPVHRTVETRPPVPRP